MARGSLFLVLIAVLVSSCTLSTQQEMSLNKDIHQFIQVRNEGDALSFLNYIHPAVVRYYKDLGDSTFNEKFKALPQGYNQNGMQTDVVFWDQGIIKKVVKKDSLIEAKLKISLIKNSKSLDSTTIFYAISKSDASNWLFVSEDDYFNVLRKEERLID